MKTIYLNRKRLMEADGTCLTYDEWLLRIKDNK